MKLLHSEPAPQYRASAAPVGDHPHIPSIVRDSRAMVELGVKFPNLYADAPWPYSNTAARGAAVNHRRPLALEANQVERKLF